MRSTAFLPPEIPRLLLMRWEGIEFWGPSLCERDRVLLGDVRRAIDDLKHLIAAHRGTAPANELPAADRQACQAAFDHVCIVSRRVGNELRGFAKDKTQSQLWRGRHIAHLLEGIEDESRAAASSQGQGGNTPRPTKEGHPALQPDARN